MMNQVILVFITYLLTWAVACGLVEVGLALEVMGGEAVDGCAPGLGSVCTAGTVAEGGLEASRSGSSLPPTRLKRAYETKMKYLQTGSIEHKIILDH